MSNHVPYRGVGGDRNSEEVWDEVQGKGYPNSGVFIYHNPIHSNRSIVARSMRVIIPPGVDIKTIIWVSTPCVIAP